MGQKQSSLLKKADVPANLQRLDTPVSKEYDTVQRVYGWYIVNKVDTLPWRDFQKQFPFAQNSPLFTQIRHNQPQITEEDLRVWLQDNQKGSKYKIDYSTYNDAENSYRDVEQLVLQINRGADATDILGQDPLLKQWVDYVGQSSGMSKHPAGMETVGWLRVDFVDQDWLLVDEVQSDLTNSVTQGKAILAAETYEEFIENLTNEKVRRLAQEKISPEQFEAGRRSFIRSGYTFEKLDEIKNKLTELFQNWAEHGIASLLEIARKQGIKNVAIHTAETISERDQSVESAKVKMYYDNLAKAFGFKKQQVNVGGLQGNFWVRTAKKKFDPRQVPLYGRKHERELQDLYAKPRTTQSALMQDFGVKEAGLYSIEDLDDYDSPLVYDLMGMHDNIHLNPTRGVVPDYGSEYQGQQIWQFTYGAVKSQLLPAVQAGVLKCSPAGQKKVKALIDEAVGALSLSDKAASARNFREAGMQAEFAFSKLHTAIELIRMETRKKRKGKSVPVSEPKSLEDYT